MNIKNIAFTILTLLVLTTSYGQKENTKEPKWSQEIIYKIIDGDTLKLHLYHPDGFKKWKKYPTLVFFFGGGWNGGSVTQFAEQAEYFSSRGMVSVLVDYRVKSRNQTTPFDAVMDAKSAMRFIRGHAKELGVDPNKIVASGGSAGGHLAAATALLPGLNEENDDLSVSPMANALVLYNPVIDNSENGYGFDRIGDRYLEISPIHNIKKGAPPTIFFLGDQDKLIPVSTAYEYKEKMEAVGSRCDVFIYKNQGHGFFNKGRQKGDKCYFETTQEADWFLQSIGYLNGKAKI